MVLVLSTLNVGTLLETLPSLFHLIVSSEALKMADLCWANQRTNEV